jgi:D-alanine-D-alanine ligase
MKKNVAILFGGVSAEHEVSVITGLQVIEQIDRERYEPYAIYVTKKGLFKYQSVKARKDFKVSGGNLVNFGKDENGVYFSGDKIAFRRKFYPDAAYLAFHGGYGESGSIQGFFEVLGLPFTSPALEASAITMNKVLTKEVLEKYEILTLPWTRFFSRDIKENVSDCAKVAVEHLHLPVIIKPVHLGSSIAINIAKTEVELKKYLLEAAHVDSEILVEKLLKNFTEYNCAVRLVDGKVEASEIERPISSDEILSFADKYQKGGNKKGAGMASLVRELPAKMSKKLRDEVQEIARRAFIVTRCKGMVRIDFMVTKNVKIYLTEINPIPGSMAFYLWEASGVTFTQQITDSIEQSIKDFEYHQSLKLDYGSDIVEKFVGS